MKPAVLAENALLSSLLDYCNSLFRSLSSFKMHKLQCIQNTLGRIVINCNRYSQATLILKKLFCLLDEFLGIFKTATLVYKFLHTGHSIYFSPHLSIHCQRYGTTYNRPDKRFLEVPQYYPSVQKSKKTLWAVLLLMLPHFGMICLMMFILFQLLPVPGKKKILSL